MTSDLVTYLRALAEKHPWTVRSAARMRQPLDGADAQALEGALCSTERERDEARAEVERLRDEDTKTRHALRGWVWVCPDGGDEPTHERVSAVVAEVERLRKEMLEVAEELENEEPRSHKNIAFGIRNALEAKP